MDRRRVLVTRGKSAVSRVAPEEPPVRRKPEWFWLLTVVVAVAICGGGLFWAGTAGSTSHSAKEVKEASAVHQQQNTTTSATETNSPTAPTKPISSIVARSSLSSFLTAVTAIKPKTTDIASQLSAVAAGAIVAEIANQQQELNANGWTLKGNPAVDSVKILSTDASANPATASVQACIDSSSVVTLDSDGKPLGTQTGPAARALNFYTLQYGTTGWRVISRTFPDNPNC